MQQAPVQSRTLKNYLDKLAIKPAGGGLTLESAVIMDLLLTFQREKGLRGHMVEIGTHRGVTAGFFATHIQNDESLVLVDIHIDHHAIEESMLTLLGQNPGFVQKVEADSGQLRKRGQLDEANGMCRLVHVDGEHSYGAVYGDLEMAVRLVSRYGLIVVDDFMSPTDPMITDATFRFVREHSHEVCMFLTGFNKAYLCHPSMLYHYRSLCANFLMPMMEHHGVLVHIKVPGFSTEMDYLAISANTADYPKWSGINQTFDTMPSIYAGWLENQNFYG